MAGALAGVAAVALISEQPMNSFAGFLGGLDGLLIFACIRFVAAR
jgi:hypothetical protein